MCDQDGDGQVSYEEFKRLFSVPEPAPAAPALEDAAVARPKYTDMKIEKASGAELLLGHGEGTEGLEGILLQFTGGQKLKPNFIKRVYKKFQQVDTHNTGQLDYNGFLQVFGAEDSPLMRRMFDVFDTDNSRTIGLKELVVGLSSYTSASKTDKLKFAFMMYDEDGSGAIDRDELQKILQSNFLSYKLTEEELLARTEQIYARLQVPVGAHITYEMFMQLHKQMPQALFPSQARTAQVAVDGMTKRLRDLAEQKKA